MKKVLIPTALVVIWVFVLTTFIQTLIVELVQPIQEMLAGVGL